MQLLTQSRLAAQRACQRLHHLKYDLGYSAIVELGGRRFGTLVHKGLEAWWRARMTIDAGSPAADAAALAMALEACAGEADPFERVKAEVLLTGYHERWKHEPYDVLGVEAEFMTTLRNPSTGAASRTWDLAGKLDVIVRDPRDGNVKFIEHKTSSEDITPGSIYWRRLRMDTQVSVYFEGARALGHDAAACIYDVIGKPGLRPGAVPLLDDDGVKIVHDGAGQRVRTKDGKKWRETGDTAQGYVLQTRPETPEEYRARLTEAVAAEPDRYFARGEVVRIGDEMEDALVDIWQLGQQIRENEIAGRHPRNPAACLQDGRPCDFLAICAGEASLDDETQFTRSDRVHPELEAASNTNSSKEESQSL
jgi:hypothetical protein